MSLDNIQEALKSVKYPGFSRDIVSFGLVRGAEFSDGKATVSVSVSTSDHSIPAKIRDDIESALSAIDEVNEVQVNISVKPTKEKLQAEQGQAPTGAKIAGVKHVIAVASGKGGVGKSTFAVNLATALSKIYEPQGKKVGIMDCDIYGPSVPLMLGLEGRPFVQDESLIPLEKDGIKVMSMGFLIDKDTPVVWRGPMIMKTIRQFIQNVIWGELEVIVIDLPPGTGDAQLSLVQTVELSGAVLVTTPQQAATTVAIRGAKMLEKTNVPILGVAENMSYYIAPDGSQVNMFGEGGGEATAKELNAKFLGQIPLDPEIRTNGDAGTPITSENPDSDAAKAFMSVAQSIVEQLQ